MIAATRNPLAAREETMTSHVRDRGDRDDHFLAAADIAGRIGAYEQTVRS